MPGRPTYTESYKRAIIVLVRSGYTPSELGEIFQPTPTTIRDWFTKFENEGRISAEGLPNDEQGELSKKIEKLEEERDALARALAWAIQKIDLAKI
jgi:hypothetical protein